MLEIKLFLCVKLQERLAFLLGCYFNNYIKLKCSQFKLILVIYVFKVLIKDCYNLF